MNEKKVSSSQDGAIQSISSAMKSSEPTAPSLVSASLNNNTTTTAAINVPKSKKQKLNRSTSPNPSSSGGGGNSSQQQSEKANASLTAATLASMSAVCAQSSLSEVLPALQVVLLSLASSKSTGKHSQKDNNVGNDHLSTSLNTNLLKLLRAQCQKNIGDNPPFVHLSGRDCAPQLTIVDTSPVSLPSSSPAVHKLNRRTTVEGGMRGYRMVRATHGVSSGIWYYEVLVLDPLDLNEVIRTLPQNARLGQQLKQQFKTALTPATNKESTTTTKSNKRQRTTLPKEEKQVGGNLRMGWSMRTGELQAPVGYDKWSYGYRDISGSRIHASQREDKWGGFPYGPGDVIGFAISLVGDPNKTDPVSKKNSSGGTKDDPMSSFSNHIRFFKNGEPMGEIVISRGNRSGGESFDNIQPGTYYPAISTYMGGSARANFGPYFICPPRHLPNGMKKLMRPMSEVCPMPLTPEEALTQFKKERGKSKRADEMVMSGVMEAVKVEAGMRYECYQHHMAMHIEEVRMARMDRNLSTGDLPPRPSTEEDMKESD